MGFSALYYAAIGNHVSCAKKLIEARVNVSLPDAQVWAGVGGAHVELLVVVGSSCRLFEAALAPCECAW